MEAWTYGGHADFMWSNGKYIYTKQSKVDLWCRTPPFAREETEVAEKMSGKKRKMLDEVHKGFRNVRQETECLDSMIVDTPMDLEVSADYGDRTQLIIGESASISRIHGQAKHFDRGLTWKTTVDAGEYRACVTFPNKQEPDGRRHLDAILRIIATGSAGPDS